MKLGLAMKKLGGMTDGTGQTDLDRVVELVAAAHRGAREAIAELRDLCHGIHPPVLDQGLGIALTTLAARSDLPVGIGEPVHSAVRAATLTAGEGGSG
jgi:signal transduction histidine kinase